MSFFKTPMYRNRKLLDLAKKGEVCFFCFQHKPLAFAHSNQSRDGKGGKVKAHDYRIALACLECGYEIDNGNKYSRAERIEKWEEAHRLTIAWLFDNGHLEVIEK